MTFDCKKEDSIEIIKEIGFLSLWESIDKRIKKSDKGDKKWIVAFGINSRGTHSAKIRTYQDKTVIDIKRIEEFPYSKKEIKSFSFIFCRILAMHPYSTEAYKEQKKIEKALGEVVTNIKTIIEKAVKKLAEDIEDPISSKTSPILRIDEFIRRNDRGSTSNCSVKEGEKVYAEAKEKLESKINATQFL